MAVDFQTCYQLYLCSPRPSGDSSEDMVAHRAAVHCSEVDKAVRKGFADSFVVGSAVRKPFAGSSAVDMIVVRIVTGDRMQKDTLVQCMVFGRTMVVGRCLPRADSGPSLDRTASLPFLFLLGLIFLLSLPLLRLVL